MKSGREQQPFSYFDKGAMVIMIDFRYNWGLTGAFDNVDVQNGNFPVYV